LSGAEFAAKHGKTPAAAQYTHRILIGCRHRSNPWWTAPDVLAVLSSDRPDREVAAALDLRPHSLRRMRSACRKIDLGVVARRVRPKLWWMAPEVHGLLLR
jgi:hypothetical protein